MSEEKVSYYIGAHVEVRDAEWRVLDIQPVPHAGTDLVFCEGISELVRGMRAEFISSYEKGIKVLLPEETLLTADTSDNFSQSRLYLESLLRTAPRVSRDKIFLAHRAAMDALPYQFNPTLQALRQPRARILIADAVGLGKTLEAGILCTELIVRGRGRRILAVTTKAMMAQFQQEFWNRFSIPLERLDSEGIERVRGYIPENHNPFEYFNRVIISVDTLKQQEYLESLGETHWDIIILDEAHNAARRGSARSQRSKLAAKLAIVSDTMIMLSATPHDGSAGSFASLLNMLDPTALVDPEHYGVKDFASKGLVIRRFKRDVRNQVQMEFPESIKNSISVNASAEENAVYELLAAAKFVFLDSTRAEGAWLFATVLTKAMFSSPGACASVIEHRISSLDGKIERIEDYKKSDRAQRLQALQDDRQQLVQILGKVREVTPDKFTKLKQLVSLLSPDWKDTSEWSRWTRGAQDRLVVFTESVVTLLFLQRELPSRCGLKEDEVKILHGGMKDTEIFELVAEFGRKDSPLRLLLCSDVASEGINLHHLAHRVIHFDIPWSLMVFQQRNGRIDRYGQTEVPQILYLQTMAGNKQIRDDAGVLEVLRRKDSQAQENLEDPAEFMGTQEEQEDYTAAKMEGRAAAAEVSEDELDFAMFYAADAKEQAGPELQALRKVMSRSELEQHKEYSLSLYRDDMDFARAAFTWLGKEYARVKLHAFDHNDLELHEHHILFRPREELMGAFRRLPREIFPADGRFDLTDNIGEIEAELDHARSQDASWPARQYLWPLHPVMQWLQDSVLTSFGRHTAPVVRLRELQEGEIWGLFHGGYSNRGGYIPVHCWIAVRAAGETLSVHSLEEFIEATHMDGDLSNACEGGLPEAAEPYLRNYLIRALPLCEQQVALARAEYDRTDRAELEKQFGILDELKGRHLLQAEKKYAEMSKGLREKRLADERARIDRMFLNASNYITLAVDTQDKPYIQVAVLVCSEDAGDPAARA